MLETSANIEKQSNKRKTMAKTSALHASTAPSTEVETDDRL